jgi:predicted ArsR family transcriptional regulator
MQLAEKGEGSNGADGAVDLRMVRALGHPMRQRILRFLNEDGESSPVQIARALGQRLGNIAYHCGVLEECGAIELSRTAPARGAVEHFYRAVQNVSWTPLELDQKAYRRLLEEIDRLNGRAAALQAQAQRRLEKLAPDERAGQQVDMGMMFFGSSAP